MNQIDETVRRAMEAQTKAPLSTRIQQWAARQSPAKIIGVLFAMAFLVGITLYEMLNSAAGWRLIAQSAVPWLVAWSGGAALVLGYISYHRKAAEQFRASDRNAWRSALVALLCMSLALFGVFSNLSSKTGMVAGRAAEAASDRADLRAEMQTLQARAGDVQMLQAETLVRITSQQIESLEAEAVGWGMVPETEDDSPADIKACATDLRPRQRQICNELNGSGESMGLRNELEFATARVDGLALERARIVEIQETLAAMPIQEGREHWEAMSRVSMGKYTEDDVRVWGTFFASVLFLLASGFGWERFQEDRENEFDEV